ncbi:MAG TPA: YhjD/YihY/BrkB family envelope integrity protein [Baekduia sp.]|uniref:YhjD/YihY/BrkB family envelope integrity protein n=1 Tax=Baekduia sp. TaxID=2600305 RepID=UPI002C74BF5C|nr:YhjD/YihY/BrkB family envelope integrity protein [Baekduia sp.]HMJ36680.1 YhjD/YihY/BrkB family envelope integrity protein [Baekduia sp.]
MTGGHAAVARLARSGRGVLERLLELEIIDRSLVVGAQAFSALIPLLIVLSSLGARGGESFANGVIDRFGLSGAGADAVHRTFDAPADDTTITLLGGLVVVYSTLAFTRALQRTFERAWDLPRRGMKGTGWGLLWIGVIAAYWAVVPVAGDDLPSPLGTAAALAASFLLWLVTPYVLLARRVPWRALVPQAALSAIGMTILGIGAAIYAPRAIGSSASEFGVIGVAFALLSLLWAAGFVLVTAAAIGSYITVPTWRPVSPGSVTPPSSSTSPAPGS